MIFQNINWAQNTLKFNKFEKSYIKPMSKQVLSSLTDIGCCSVHT